MKRFFLFLFLTTVTLNLFSQTTVSGRIVDDQKQPVPYATVCVNKNNQLLYGTTSAPDGRFEIDNIAKGEYVVLFSSLGYDNQEKHMVCGSINKVLDLGTIVLHESAIEVDEVNVTAHKRTVASGLDKKSFSTEELISNSNGSVLEAMKQLPGVTVSQDGKVMLRGSDKVLVLIDGKQSSLTGFDSQKGLDFIPASQIERIEIINNPSSKYDAGGTAGIVNIKFKEQKKKGFNGEAGFSFGLGSLGKRKADLPTGMSSYSMNPKYTPSLSLNYRTEKFNFFLQGYMMNQAKLPNNEFTTRHYPNGDFTESQVAENRKQNHYNVKLGFDWTINEKQTLTVFGLYDYEWHIDTTKVWYFRNKDYVNPIRKWGFNESEGTGFTNVTLQHRLKFNQLGHELNSQYLFTKGWEDETYNLYQDETTGFPAINGDRTHVVAPEYVHQLSTDYVKPLTFGRFEAGAQARFRNMPITYTMDRATPNTALIFDFGDWSKWTEDLYAVYANLNSETKYVDIEAGLRGEFTDVTYKFAPNQYFKDNTYDYFKLFPNMRFTFKVNDKNRISLFYNRRIDRPGEDILRIFPKYDDPELLKIGNPELRPQLTDAVELAYRLSWSGGSFYAAAYYKNISDHYTRIYIQDPTHPEITIKGYSNIPRATNTGLELNMDQGVTKFWKLNLNANIYRNKIFAHKGTIDFPQEIAYEIAEQTDAPWFVKMNNLFTVSKRIKLELNGVYFSEKAIAQGKDLSRWGVDFGVRTNWLNDILEVSLTGNDIFNTMGIRQRIDQGNGYSTDYNNFYETQIISLGAKYKF